MSGFGRKGLAPGQAAPAQGGGFGRAVPASPAPARAPASPPMDEMAAKRQAFIDAERLRNSSGAQPASRIEEPADQAGLSSYAENYQSKHYAQPQRSLAMAYVLWFILGQLSAHRFYLGRMQSAMMQVGLFMFSIVAIFTAAPWVGAIGFIAWCFWILGDVFFIHKIHKEDWQRAPAFGSVFN